MNAKIFCHCMTHGIHTVTERGHYALIQPRFCIGGGPYMHSWHDSGTHNVPTWQVTEFTFKTPLKCSSVRSWTS